MSSFPLIVTSVDMVHFDGAAQSVTLPGSEGELTVLKGHEPFVSVLKRGAVVVRSEDGETRFDIEKGVLEVHHGGVTVLI